MNHNKLVNILVISYFVVTYFLPFTTFVDLEVDFTIPWPPLPLPFPPLLENDENDVKLKNGMEKIMSQIYDSDMMNNFLFIFMVIRNI